MYAAVSYSAKARRDIRREWNYLFKKANPAIADAFLDALEKTSSILLNAPGIGSLCEFTAPKARRLRRFPITLAFGNWLLFYEPTDRGITVQRIAHGARDLHRFFGQ